MDVKVVAKLLLGAGFFIVVIATGRLIQLNVAATRAAEVQKAAQDSLYQEQLLKTLQAARDFSVVHRRNPTSDDLVEVQYYIPAGAAGFVPHQGFKSAYRSNLPIRGGVPPYEGIWLQRDLGSAVPTGVVVFQGDDDGAGYFRVLGRTRSGVHLQFDDRLPLSLRKK